MANREKVKSLWEEFKDLKKLWPYLRSEKKLIWIAAILIPVISALEMYVPIIIKWTIDDGISKKNLEILKYGSAIYLGLVILQYLSRSVQSLAAAFAVHRMVLSLRNKLIRHVLSLSCSYHDRSMSGALVTRATSDFDNLSESLNTGVLTSVVDFAVLFGTLIGLFYLNWQLAACSLVIFPIVYLVVTKFSDALKDTMLKARVKIAELNAFTQECLYGSSTIKLLNAQKAAQLTHDRLAEEYRKMQMGTVIMDASMYSIVDGLTSITVGIILFAAVVQFTNADLVTAGMMVAFVQYIQQMFEPIKQLSNKIAMLNGAFTSIDRIFGILDTKAFIGGSEDVSTIRGDIHFDNVSFAYKNHQPVLNAVNFNLQPGQSLALVGATGSGKSTIIKLITKLYDGYTGEIYLDGKELRTVDGELLRKRISIVPQDIVLFDGTVEFNITLGLDSISPADAIRAAKTVGADDFIRKLPLGYAEPIREQGSNLSHGMRQLIAFARALAKNPDLIILDEATSSVDPESETLIQSGIESLMQGRTVIVIAHRLSTIRSCDKILVLERGVLIEQGNHEALLSQGGTYFQLHEALV